MRTITITPAAMDLIMAASTAPGGFNQTATRRPDGDFECPIEDITYMAILGTKFPDETISDCIVRILSMARGAN